MLSRYLCLLALAVLALMCCMEAAGEAPLPGAYAELRSVEEEARARASHSRYVHGDSTEVRSRRAPAVFQAGSIALVGDYVPWYRDQAHIAVGAGTILVLASLVVILFVQSVRRGRAEAEVRRRRDQVAHLERVVTLGQLAGTFTHELKQPLSATLLNAQAALRVMPPDAPIQLRELLEDIRADAQRATDLVSRLRDLIRKAPRRVEPVWVDRECRAVLAMLHSHMATRRISVDIESADDLPCVTGDGAQLRQVFFHLLLNAADAVERVPSAARVIKVSCRPAGARMVEVTVADSGPGISNGTFDQLFEPFFTTKPDGLGLGLSVTRTIVEAHDGTVQANTNPGGGAAFTVLLPAAMVERSVKTPRTGSQREKAGTA